MQPPSPAPLAMRCAIAIMAKTPRAGRSKTRLCPPLTPDQAATLSGAFLSDMAATVLRAAAEAPIDLFVAYAPAGEEAALRSHLPPAATLLLADGAGVNEPGVSGFGRPLLQTLRHLLGDGYGAACVLNSDSPTLPATHLVAAARLLLEAPDRVVLGPARDGGYYILGLGQDLPTLFTDIPWSTPDVTARTRAQARDLELTELPPWYDVDDAASLNQLIDELDTAGDAAAPRTAWMLAALGLHQGFEAQRVAAAD